MTPPNGDDDLRINIDWGDEQRSLAPKRRPLDWAELEESRSTHPPRPASSWDSDRQPAAGPAEDPIFRSALEERYQPPPEDDFNFGLGNEEPQSFEPASMEAIDAGVDNANRRIEALFTEAAKLRELTNDRLSQFAAEVASVSTVADALRATVSRETGGLTSLSSALTQVPADLGQLLAGVHGLTTMLEEVGVAQRELSRTLEAAFEALGTRIESRVQRTTADAVARLRKSIEELEVNLRESLGAASSDETNENLAAMTEEIQQVKRRLALRAKAPPAVLADEQIDHIVKAVTAAVRNANKAAAAPPTPANAVKPARAAKSEKAEKKALPAPEPKVRRRRNAT